MPTNPPITTSAQLICADRGLFDEEVAEEEKRLRGRRYFQRYDGTVTSSDDIQSIEEAISKPRGYVFRAGLNFEEDRMIAQIDRRRSRDEREMRALRREAPMPRVQKLYRSTAEFEAAEAAKRSEAEETWKQVTSPAHRERLIARGIVRRRVA